MLGIVSLGVAQEVVTGPAIALDKDVHDYGTIQQGANGTCEFTVTNSGTEPLIRARADALFLSARSRPLPQATRRRLR